MGIVNVTPDSFSDGGEFLQTERAIEHAEQLLAEGADIVDIGGESSRPGAEPVSLDEELRRVIPVVQALAQTASTIISVDTVKPEVARRALAAGAHIINDISGARDRAMLEVVTEYQAGLVIMHMSGDPQTMQLNPHYADVVDEVREFLRSRLAAAEASGLAAANIAIDPGIGFGKTFSHNWEILGRMDEYCSLGRPVLVGASRKGFLRDLVGKERSRLAAATCATSLLAARSGAKIFRVHDVGEHVAALAVLSKLLD